MNNQNKQQSASSHPDFFKHLLSGFGSNYAHKPTPKAAPKSTPKPTTKKKK